MTGCHVRGRDVDRDARRDVVEISILERSKERLGGVVNRERCRLELARRLEFFERAQGAHVGRRAVIATVT